MLDLPAAADTLLSEMKALALAILEEGAAAIENDLAASILQARGYALPAAELRQSAYRFRLRAAALQQRFDEAKATRERLTTAQTEGDATCQQNQG